MQYSSDFVEKVKAEHPTASELHEALEAGNNDLVGSLLASLKHFPMPPEHIIEAFEDGREQEVLEDARKAKSHFDLLSEWLRDY